MRFMSEKIKKKINGLIINDVGGGGVRSVLNMVNGADKSYMNCVILLLLLLCVCNILDIHCKPVTYNIVYTPTKYYIYYSYLRIYIDRPKRALTRLR